VSATGARVLVVDDEPPILRVVRRNLEARGFQVETAEDGASGLDRFYRWRPDVVLLDLGLPDIDGLDFIARVREASATPIVVLSARGAERDKVSALDAGADDYLSKPFGVEELLARIRVALRHGTVPAAGAAARRVVGDLTLDLEQRRLLVRGEEVRLTPTEWELLKVFVANPGKLMTDRALLRAVWGPEYGSESHYLHVYVARLRKKIERDPARPRCLVTEPGAGYRFVEA
jgi:two-component system KDP operon response regulator KdpE